MKHKTSELLGALLDDAVLQALIASGEEVTTQGMPWPYSTNWRHGGPIIDREDIQLGGYGTSRQAEIRNDSKPWVSMWGETSLIAAMRAYVASKLGDEVEL